MRPIVLGTSAALVIAHPGHELRVHGWLEIARPKVFVLTDGSGRSGRSRLESTSKILSQAGAERGDFYGRLTDQVIYSAMLNHDFDLFTNLATELAELFVHHRIEYVAGDANEGYNPAHDLCRVIINAVVEATRRRAGRQIGNFDFSLMGAPDNCPQEVREHALWLNLDGAAFERKLRVARSYPELLPEVNAAIHNNGKDAFRLECLRPVKDTHLMCRSAEKPLYEQYGETRVAAGYYERVLRYRDHFLPVAEAILEHVEKST